MRTAQESVILVLAASPTQELINPSAVESLLAVLVDGRQKWYAEHAIHVEAALEALLQHGMPLAEVIQEAASQLEKQIILQVLTFTKGNKVAAAKILKIDYKTLYRKIKRHNL